ncbi:MAG: FHA domain-containing protein [Anaerolineales bacterium]
MTCKHNLPLAMFLGSGIFFFPIFQGGVKSVDDFFNWWYTGLGGLGGWAIFLLIAIGANAYIFFDSQSRGVPAMGWKAAGLLPILLILPTLLFRFSSGETQQSLLNLLETFFFIGIIGGIVPLAAAVGYAINFTGYTPPLEPPPQAYPSPPPFVPKPAPSPPPQPPPRPRPTRPHANAWLIEPDTNRSHQLFQGDTRLGRGTQNDIALTDRAVSREHALIREENGHFTLYDRGSRTGIYLNGQRLQRPELLANGDTIELGDTRLQFVTGQ